jgi:lipopolysaccharide export system protein LptA
MYIQKFYPEHSIIFRNNLLQVLSLLFGLFLTSSVCALSTDKDQPIEIEADTADLDDEKGISIYRGNVVTIQGSVRMTGDIMTVYFTDGELDTLIMEGKPATYKQLPDGSEIYDEAEALRMEYYELKSLVILIDKASFKQEGLSFSGNRIEYDTEHSKVKARGSIKQQSGAGDSSASGTSGERVKIILKPKKKKE